MVRGAGRLRYVLKGLVAVDGTPQEIQTLLYRRFTVLLEIKGERVGEDEVQCSKCRSFLRIY